MNGCAIPTRAYNYYRKRAKNDRKPEPALVRAARLSFSRRRSVRRPAFGLRATEWIRRSSAPRSESQRFANETKRAGSGRLGRVSGIRRAPVRPSQKPIRGGESTYTVNAYTAGSVACRRADFVCSCTTAVFGFHASRYGECESIRLNSNEKPAHGRPACVCIRYGYLPRWTEGTKPIPTMYRKRGLSTDNPTAAATVTAARRERRISIRFDT